MDINVGKLITQLPNTSLLSRSIVHNYTAKLLATAVNGSFLNPRSLYFDW